VQSSTPPQPAAQHPSMSRPGEYRDRRSPREEADERTKQLPLRLWADAGGHARALCGQRGEKCFVLGASAQGSTWSGPGPKPGVALVLGSGSVAAIVCDAAEPPTSRQLCELLRLGATGANLLPPVLMQRMSDDSCRLHVISDGADPQTVSFGEAREMMDAGRVARIDSGFACCMVESIRSYYFMQVQEPSVKGFLSLLENAIFPRNDLYLFELLQNAVDDEAGSVRFEAVHEDDGEGSSGPSLRIWHDGREFSPLDVFGLSSVGFSAKSGRTVRR
jgi:hypothetical protein